MTTPDVGTGLRRSRRQLELYTVLSFDSMVFVCGAGQIFDVWAWSRSWGALEGVATAVILLFVAASMALVHRIARGWRPGRGLLVGYIAMALAAAAGSVMTKTPDAFYRDGAGSYFAALLSLYTAFAVLALVIAWRRLLPWGAPAGVAVGGMYAVLGVHPFALAVVAFYGVCAAWAGIAVGGFTFWTLDVVRQLDEARAAAARLAVAEERLRFSRDLHDVYGRTLSSISMMSELAAELAARGDARAVTQMQSVRELAQSSLSDVRRIVTGYREISLDAELAGAVSLLRSAGARVEVTGLDAAQAALGPQGRTALAWVVREAVTNIVRHSRARQVRIVGDVDSSATVRLANDGVRPVAASTGGSGLAGLAERLDAVGGTVEAAQDGTWFALTVRLPVGV